ncbi:nitrile hydratase accessory protein [Actinacidiphila glaucinigra]|uniref:nitrile hydratase accessory protein n=1 Tax=Actinacidiphila glaucinigra TaxID=235986 RepID=UPI0033C3A358
MTAPLNVDGPAAPPRSNGELVFAEPWESRAFGMAVALHEAGAFAWPRFQAALISRIRAWEDGRSADEAWDYYRLWLAALEDVLTEQDVVRADEVTTRARTLDGRPAGHDHGDHGGDHHDHHNHHDHDDHDRPH